MKRTISAARSLAAASVALLLGACASIQSGPTPSQQGKQPAPVSAPPAAQTITLAGSIEHHHLSISYSMNILHGRGEDMLRVALIFRNLDDKYKPIRPRVALTDAAGATLPAYSAEDFKRAAAKLGKAQAAQLANMSWLDPSYRIPPQGIVLGELVYHAPKFSFPLKLTVTDKGDRFEFTAREE